MLLGAAALCIMLPGAVMTPGGSAHAGVTLEERKLPMRFSWALWTVTLNGLKPGAYEFRARAVDLNDFAQPEPRPYPKSGRNEIQTRTFTIMG